MNQIDNTNKTQLSKSFKIAATTNSNRVHIVPSKNGWSIKKEGVRKASYVKKTREDAISFAKRMKFVGEIIVHTYDGTIHKNYHVAG